MDTLWQWDKTDLFFITPKALDTVYILGDIKDGYPSAVTSNINGNALIVLGDDKECCVKTASQKHSSFELVDDIERKEGIKIHTTTIDPWNELTEEFIPADLGREDKYLSRILGLVRKNARKTGRHNCVINHVRDQPMVSAKTIAGTDISYFPMPSARDFAGGQVWFRKGLSVLIPWRPPYGLGDADGVGAEKNEVHLKVAKSKPKGVSKNGTYKLFLDVEKYQYYIKDFADNKIYANRSKHEPKPISNSFPTAKPDIVNGKELLSFSERMKQGAFKELEPIINKDGNPEMPF